MADLRKEVGKPPENKESFMQKGKRKIDEIGITKDEFDRHANLVLSNMDDDTELSDDEIRQLDGKYE